MECDIRTIPSLAHQILSEVRPESIKMIHYATLGRFPRISSLIADDRILERGVYARIREPPQFLLMEWDILSKWAVLMGEDP